MCHLIVFKLSNRILIILLFIPHPIKSILINIRKLSLCPLNIHLNIINFFLRDNNWLSSRCNNNHTTLMFNFINIPSNNIFIVARCRCKIIFSSFFVSITTWIINIWVKWCCVSSLSYLLIFRYFFRFFIFSISYSLHFLHVSNSKYFKLNPLIYRFSKFLNTCNQLFFNTFKFFMWSLEIIILISFIHWLALINSHIDIFIKDWIYNFTNRWCFLFIMIFFSCFYW